VQLLYKQYDNRFSCTIQAERCAATGFNGSKRKRTSVFDRSPGKASFPLPAYLTASWLGVKPSSAPAVPEAGVVMTAVVSDKGTRFFCHRPLQDKRGIVFAESGDIDAGNLILDLKRIHRFPVFAKLDGFLMASDV